MNYENWCEQTMKYIGMCSATGFSARAQTKLEWISKNYGVQTNNWSTGALEEKGAYVAHSILLFTIFFHLTF